LGGQISWKEKVVVGCQEYEDPEFRTGQSICSSALPSGLGLELIQVLRSEWFI